MTHQFPSVEKRSFLSWPIAIIYQVFYDSGRSTCTTSEFLRMALNRSHFCFRLALQAMLAFTPVFLSAEEDPRAAKPQDGYTINYNTISIIEYIKFASKICNVNFIFNEEDLQFTVTIVSDAPITQENVMAMLLQTLRIHGLTLLEQENSLVIHKNQAVRQIASLVFDKEQSGDAPIVTRVFRLKHAHPGSIAAILRPMLSSEALIEVSQETRQLILTDVTASVNKAAALIENLDTPHSPMEIRVYHTQFNNSDYLTHLAQQIMNPLAQGSPFILVPQTLANTIFIVSTPELNEQTAAVLANLDKPPQKGAALGGAKESEVLIIQLSHRQGEEVLENLKGIASRMQESESQTSLLDTINNANWIKETNSLVFVGNAESNAKLRQLISALDAGSTATQSTGKAQELTGPSNFSVYKIQSSKPDDLQDALKAFASNLSKAKVDPSLVRTIEGMKYIKQTNSLLFTGPDDAIKRAQDLAQQIDTGTEAGAGSSQFLVYKPQSQSGEEISKAMKDYKDHLQSSDLRDPALIRALDSMKWVKSTNSILFTGDPASLKRVEQLLATIDQPSAGQVAQAAKKTGYRIYKVQNTSGDLIEEDLERLIKNMQATGMKDTPLLKTLENIRYVKETNSLLLTGDEASVSEAETLIAKYDTPQVGAPSKPGSFFMYKPQSQSAAAIEKSLKDIGSNLKQSSLADPSLLSAISSMKYVDTTNSLIFTGSPDAIQKIQALLKDIDVPPQKHAPIQHIGKTTFLLYKLQNANATQITTSLKAISTDLKKSGAADKEFITALGTMKYVRETNSLMFTGPEEALGKVQALVEKFDVTGTSSSRPTQPAMPMETGPSNFFIYHPQALSAEEIVRTLNDFSENLKLTGLNDPELFQSIESMRYVSNGKSIVFTGNPKTLDRIKELLKDFDIPGPRAEEDVGGTADQTIQSIDNTSFLVYKLQFHRGDEIQGALRQIGKDLETSKAPINQGLLNAIQSIQWLEVTNSLLCSGDAETLTRLRELIKNLDIPLKQVFIEMLVLQTSLNNAVDFGLEWGGKLKYKDKFSGSFNNLLPTDTVSNGTFSSNLQNITAAPGSRPLPTDIPFSAGFDLGVIGDIIMHKGNSFLSLGSLINAIQNDDETTVVLTPKIIAQDGKSTSIFVGQNVPFAGSFVSNQSSNTVTTSNLEYRNIGFSLNITPVLGNSNIVTLELTIDSSSESSVPGTGSTFTFQAGQATGITTNQANMQTTVHVPDRHFFILSGMVNNSNSKQTAGIPCLGGIPLIGAAFSENNQLESLNSLVVFIRPTILNSVDEMKQLTIDQEDFFRDQAATPFLEHNFDEAMEYIKSPDDE